MNTENLVSKWNTISRLYFGKKFFTFYEQLRQSRIIYTNDDVNDRFNDICILMINGIFETKTIRNNSGILKNGRR